jgi:DNA-binding MarR family transcriptional regulator
MTTISKVSPAADASLPVIGGTVDPTLIDDANELSESLTELIRVVQFRDRDRACCYDVSVSQYYALKAVSDAGALTVNELAALLYLDKSTVSRIANGLVEQGYWARERDPADGRVVRLEVTDEGRGLCARIAHDLAREYAELLADLDPEVRSAISQVVRRLGHSFASRVDTSGGTCCMVK